jgi:uncharacterized protein (TIGR02118 family)
MACDIHDRCGYNCRMVKLIILFRTGARPVELREQYNDFLMKLDALPGLRRKSVSTVYGSTSGTLPYSTVVEAVFDSAEAMETALTSPPGIMAGHLLTLFAGPDAIALFADTLEEAYQ